MLTLQTFSHSAAGFHFNRNNCEKKLLQLIILCSYIRAFNTCRVSWIMCRDSILVSVYTVRSRRGDKYFRKTAEFWREFPGNNRVSNTKLPRQTKVVRFFGKVLQSLIFLKILKADVFFAGHRHYSLILSLWSKVKASPVNYMPTMTSLNSTLSSSLYSFFLFLAPLLA